MKTEGGESATIFVIIANYKNTNTVKNKSFYNNNSNEYYNPCIHLIVINNNITIRLCHIWY